MATLANPIEETLPEFELPQREAAFFYGLFLLENSSVKSALPPVLEPLHSDAACPILLGPL